MSFFDFASLVSRKLAETGVVSWCHRMTGTVKTNPEVEQDTMCCCVPLRTAVFVNAFCTMTLSILLITCKSWFEDEFRPFQGGYARSSSVIIGFVELTGVCWGAMGVIGVVVLKSSFIQIYLQYQVARICAVFYMYYTDVPLLWECERWRTDLYGAIADHGWNPVMYKIAMGNRCYTERWYFIIFSTFYGFCLLYFAQINRRLCQTVEGEPRYLLNVPKNHPNGAFYSYSSGMDRDKPKKNKSEYEAGPMGMMGHMAPMGMGPHPGMMPPMGGMMGPHTPLVGPPMGVHGPPMGMMGPGMHPPTGTLPPGMMTSPMH